MRWPIRPSNCTMKTALSFKDNDNWKDTQQAEIEATGLQPTNDLESAIFQTLAPGAYTRDRHRKDDLTGSGAGGSLPASNS